MTQRLSYNIKCLIQHVYKHRKDSFIPNSATNKSERLFFLFFFFFFRIIHREEIGPQVIFTIIPPFRLYSAFYHPYYHQVPHSSFPFSLSLSLSLSLFRSLTDSLPLPSPLAPRPREILRSGLFVRGTYLYFIIPEVFTLSLICSRVYYTIFIARLVCTRRRLLRSSLEERRREREREREGEGVRYTK